MKHVKFHLNRFLRRVRIHGGEFDTSARAMYRNEVVYPLQADLRIVRRSTNERKQMSTKTTFKRIALVTVAALGFGVLSTVPSSAVHQADQLTLSASTATQTTAETYTATAATATIAFQSSGEADSMSVTASIVSAPAGSTAYPWLRLVETSSAVVAGTAAKLKTAYGTQLPPHADTLLAGQANALTAFVSSSAGASSVTAVSAKFAVYMASNSDAKVAPVLAGTYVIKLTPAVAGGGGALQSVAQNVTITVTTAASLDKVPSATLSTVRLTKGDTTTPTTVDTDDTIVASKASTAAVATIKIDQLNAAGSANASESITAIVTGQGVINTGAAAYSGSIGAVKLTELATAKARVLSAKAGDIIQIFADGGSGAGTVTLTSSSGVAMGSVKVTFFDTKPVTVTTTVKKAYIAAGATTTKVLSVVVADASGNLVTNATVTAYPTDTATTVASQTAQTCTLNATSTGYDCSLVGASATKFGPVGYTVKAVGTDAAKTEVKSTTASVTYSDIVAAKVTITGAATGTPGELVTYTLTATDKNGYPIADTSYNNAASATLYGTGFFFEEITASGWATAPFGLTDTITTVSGVATSKAALPIAGTAKGTWTLLGDGTAAEGAIAKAISGTDVVVSTDVSNPGVDAAAAAAEEATAAANDATDAALSAAEAAEAATAMAQEAVDAVAELSASVTKLISALRAQITTLTNLVVKIQKKVKA